MSIKGNCQCIYLQLLHVVFSSAVSSPASVPLVTIVFRLAEVTAQLFYLTTCDKGICLTFCSEFFKKVSMVFWHCRVCFLI